MIKIRASSLSQIMTDPKSGDGLSVGAMTVLNEMAKEYTYGFHQIISSKYMDKGTQCEDDSIELYNSVFFTSHIKNKERKENDWITGECDIFTPEKIIDIKTAWSLATFPATQKEVADIAKKSGYDWQGRAYMWLWNVPVFEVAYCMVSTPDDLVRYEQADLHYVDYINPALRVSRITIERDTAMEEKIKHKVGLAREYILQQVEQIKLEHA